MIEAILFDLDNTLLGNNVNIFVPRYFSLLGGYPQQFLDRDTFLSEMMICTRAMLENTDPAVTNQSAFWHMMEKRTGVGADVFEPFFDTFYQNEFSQLASLTQVRPIAQTLVRSCMDNGFKVVVATNPVFPRTAIEQRLAWAGVSAEEFDYDLITTYENMHAVKPHVAYYTEILEKIQCAPEKAIMVGDNWDHDIEPPAALGMHAFWIDLQGNSPPDESLVAGYGSLDDLHDHIQAGWLQDISKKREDKIQ